MPFLVEHLIDGKPGPITIAAQAPLTDALDLMGRYDYSQLPVLGADSRLAGLVTYEGILRCMRSFRATLDSLHVRDVMGRAITCTPEDNLFDLLAKLELTSAVLIVNASGALIGIVTSYDSTQYFRNRAEHLMRIEDIESTIKEIILLDYTLQDGSLDEARLAKTISRVNSGSSEDKTFDDLSLGQYVSILTNKGNWQAYEAVFQVPRELVRNLMDDIRETRNTLAHFRSELTAEQIDQLRFCADWLARQWDAYQHSKHQRQVRKLFQAMKPVSGEQAGPAQAEDQPAGKGAPAHTPALVGVDQPLQAAPSGLFTREFERFFAAAADRAPARQSADSRYEPLLEWLQRRPGGLEQVTLRFSEIEERIGGSLPDSARKYRAWWANDPQGQPHSRLWLEAGWRRSALNMTEEQVTFTRIREREKDYIDFYSCLIADLKTRAAFPVKAGSPDGTNWIVCQTLAAPGGASASPSGSSTAAYFSYSFARGQRFRIELLIDTGSDVLNKRIFDGLYARRADLEAQFSELSWERLDNRAASRVALYHPGAITDPESDLAGLRAWAVDTMIAFYSALQPLAEQVILESWAG